MSRNKDLPNLDEKTVEELKNMLHFQERLLRNPKFVQKLPDKGAKVENLIEKIKDIIKRKEICNLTTSMLDKLSLNDPAMDALLNEIINPNVQEKIIIDDCGESCINSYQKVMKKHESLRPKQRFQPNRSTKHNQYGNLPPLLEPERDMVSLAGNPKVNETSNVTSHKSKSSVEYAATETGCKPLDGDTLSTSSSPFYPIPKKLIDLPIESTVGKLKYHYDESLEHSSFGPPSKHSPTVEITSTESNTLIKEYQIKQQELRMKHAAELLMHSSVRSVSPQPEFCREQFSRYRDDQISDDDPDDYPDYDSEQEMDFPD